MPSLMPAPLQSIALALAMACAAPAAAGIADVPPAAPSADSAAPSAEIVPLASSQADTGVDFLRLGADSVDRMTLPVEIGTGGPYPFLIDTGSHRSIVATELAQRLSLPVLPPVEIISMAGRETVASVHVDQIRFGTQVVSDLPALSISHNALGSAGIIGLDSLRNKRVTLDFRKHQLTVGKSGPTKGEAWDRNTIVVQARSKLGQLILVNSRIDGKKVNIILDTGAETSVGNMALYNSLKLKKLVFPPQPIQITSVTGQPIQAQFAVVRKIEIESVSLQNVPMVFLDAAPFTELGLGDRPSMLLGMKMLRMFERVAIDFGNRHVDFKLAPNAMSSEPRQLLAMDSGPSRQLFAER